MRELGGLGVWTRPEWGPEPVEVLSAGPGLAQLTRAHAAPTGQFLFASALLVFEVLRIQSTFLLSLTMLFGTQESC